MARQFLFAFFIIAISLPAVTFAREFIVGDAAGWTTTYDYEGWAKGKEFRVGDKLVFKYTIGLHNLYQVNEDAYKNCIIPQDGELASGEDTIALESVGPKYFVCGVGLHCEKGGQKLSINVKQRHTQGPIQGAKTPSKSPVVAPSQSPATNALPNAPPSQSSDTNGPPYAQPSQLPTTNDSSNGVPSQSSAFSDYSDVASSPKASSKSSNGFSKTRYHLPIVIAGVLVALIVC
ncbi:unnamed protein product [Camellia sinensis]